MHRSDMAVKIKRNSLVACIGIFPGLFIVAIAAGLIPVAPDSIHAPPWLLAVCGGMFVVAGVAALGIGVLSKRVNNFFGAVILTGFSFITGWVAFGPGERIFSGFSQDATTGRAAFGLATILLVGMAVWAWKSTFQTVQTQSKGKTDESFVTSTSPIPPLHNETVAL